MSDNQGERAGGSGSVGERARQISDLLDDPEIREVFVELNTHLRYAHFVEGDRTKLVLGKNVSCESALHFIFSGHGRTDSEGVMEVNLSSEICNLRGLVSKGQDVLFVNPDKYFIVKWPHVIATPVSGRPVFITVQLKSSVQNVPNPSEGISIQSPAPDQDRVASINITFKSWGLDGKAAPQVEFAWICSGGALIAFLISG